MKTLISTAIVGYEEKMSLLECFCQLIYSSKERFHERQVQFLSKADKVDIKVGREYCNFGLYYRNNWSNCVETWAIHSRESLETLGDETTNRAEVYLRTTMGSKIKPYRLLPALVSISETGRNKRIQPVSSEFATELEKASFAVTSYAVKTFFKSLKVMSQVKFQQLDLGAVKISTKDGHRTYETYTNKLSTLQP